MTSFKDQFAVCIKGTHDEAPNREAVRGSLRAC